MDRVCSQCSGKGRLKNFGSIFRHDGEQCWRCEGSGMEPSPTEANERFLKNGMEYAHRAKEAQRKKKG